VFDWDEILNMQGNSGPYMQYTFVRCSSILAKAADQLTAEEQTQISSIAKHIDTLLYVLTQSEKAIITHLLRFDETVETAANEYAPHHLATYLYQLAQSFNTFYNSEKILSTDVPLETKAVRLTLTTAVQNVLKTGLSLLGIQTVEKM
jgi:arginyl-tRNA synthetase